MMMVIMVMMMMDNVDDAEVRDIRTQHPSEIPIALSCTMTR
jgi:hypothetical protein